jgi:hypothetical protein
MHVRCELEKGENTMKDTELLKRIDVLKKDLEAVVKVGETTRTVTVTVTKTGTRLVKSGGSGVDCDREEYEYEEEEIEEVVPIYEPDISKREAAGKELMKIRDGCDSYLVKYKVAQVIRENTAELIKTWVPEIERMLDSEET